MADAAKKKKKVRRNIPHGKVYISCSSNNTLVTLTDLDGNVVGSSSAGASGFKGTRKSTPYAAQVAAENALKDVSNFGVEKVEVVMKGVGVGRDQSLRGVSGSGVEILSITDITPVAHGGCRKKKRRKI